MFGLVRFAVTLQRLYPFWRDRAEVDALREKRLRALLRHAADRSPFYKRRFAGIDLERCALSDLPTLTKSEMMENFDDLVTDRDLKKADLSAFTDDIRNLGKLYRGRYGVSHTSGSQGQPALIVQDEHALHLIFAAQFARGTKLKRRFLPHFERFFDPARMVVLTVQPGFYPSSSAFAYLPRFLKPFFKVLKISVSDPMPDNIRKLEAFRPHYMTGYASALEAFGREQAEGRLRLRELGCLKQVTNVAEPLSAEAGARLEELFGAHVADEYALGECMVLSSGCIAGRGSHLNADLAILEVVDENDNPVPPGTEGSKVLVTNLYNHVQPIIRYEVDDRVTMAAAPCACGSLLPHIEKVGGRTKDLLWIDVGGKVREMPYYTILVALHGVLDLAEHQVVQTGLNRFVLRAAPGQGKHLSAEWIRQRVLESVKREGLEGAFDLAVEIVPEIPRGPSGKIARVRNEYLPMDVALEEMATVKRSGTR
jgi:phenylacetate-coenzyme A ligase PaaK-like adenylate-forming protein